MYLPEFGSHFVRPGSHAIAIELGDFYAATCEEFRPSKARPIPTATKCAVRLD